ncbi:MAG: glycoside hydrolase family 43 protein, partial [Mycobacteriales bacterium]
MIPAVGLLVLTGLSTPAQAYPGAPWFQPSKPYSENFPDPDVLHVGTDYYAYGTSTGGAYLPVMRSTDLTTWIARPAYDPGPPLNSDPYFNDALPYPASWGVDVNTGTRMTKQVWAPGVEHFGSTYVAFYSIRTRISPPRYCISYATASSPQGPFTDRTAGPLVCDDDPAGSIDPAPFVDPATGTAYLIWKSEGVVGSAPTKIWGRQLTTTGTAFEPGSTAHELLRTSQTWEGNVIENPSMIRQNGQLYLFYSGNEFASADYATGYATCTSALGPCTKARSGPLLASTSDRLGPGGASAFLDNAGGLRLAYHWWNAPYTSYPAYPECQQNGTCTTQGQRRMSVVELSGSGTGLQVGAATSPSPSPSPSPNAQSTSCVDRTLTVRVNTPVINATGLASVTVSGAAPGQAVVLQGYSQN